MFSTLRFSQIAAVYQSVMPLGSQDTLHTSGLAQRQNPGRTISIVDFDEIVLGEIMNFMSHRPVEQTLRHLSIVPVLDTHRVSAGEIEKLSV